MPGCTKQILIGPVSTRCLAGEVRIRGAGRSCTEAMYRTTVAAARETGTGTLRPTGCGHFRYLSIEENLRGLETLDSFPPTHTTPHLRHTTPQTLKKTQRPVIMSAKPAPPSAAALTSAACGLKKTRMTLKNSLPSKEDIAVSKQHLPNLIPNVYRFKNLLIHPIIVFYLRFLE